MLPPTVQWHRGAVRLIDQRTLPAVLRSCDCRSVDELCDAIATLAVRGAPALGAAGAFGVALAAQGNARTTAVVASAHRIAAVRPTAVNLEWGTQRALTAYLAGGFDAALGEAERIATADVAANRAIGRNGLSLVPERVGGTRVLTHCNTGHLATVGYGTALGIVRAAFEAGRVAHVFVDETRPLLQGARLTMWELKHFAIPCSLIVDSAAASLMANGEVDVVIVGADRISANGDVANKVGTYALAVLAKHHRIPFVVASPTSTIDLGALSGADIVVEERSIDEVTHIGGRSIAPDGVGARNPAFDITPATLVSAIVTENGVARRPLARSIPRLAAQLS